MSVPNTLTSKPWNGISDDGASLGNYLLGMKWFLSEIQEIGNACVCSRDRIEAHLFCLRANSRKKKRGTKHCHKNIKLSLNRKRAR